MPGIRRRRIIRIAKILRSNRVGAGAEYDIEQASDKRKRSLKGIANAAFPLASGTVERSAGTAPQKNATLPVGTGPPALDAATIAVIVTAEP